MKTYYLTVVAALASAAITLVLFQDVALLAGREAVQDPAHSVRAAAAAPAQRLVEVAASAGHA